MANEEMLHSNNDTISMYYAEVPLIKDDSALNKKRFLIVNTSSLLGLVGSYYFINTAWWADSKKSFHFDGGGSNISEAFNKLADTDIRHGKLYSHLEYLKEAMKQAKAHEFLGNRSSVGKVVVEW
jgi:hypothetical protein